MADGERKHYPPNAWHKPSMEDLAPASPAPSEGRPVGDVGEREPVAEALLALATDPPCPACGCPDADDRLLYRRATALLRSPAGDEGSATEESPAVAANSPRPAGEERERAAEAVAAEFTQEVVAALFAFSDDDTADGMKAALDRIVEAARVTLVPLAALLRSVPESEPSDFMAERRRLLGLIDASEQHIRVLRAQVDELGAARSVPAGEPREAVGYVTAATLEEMAAGRIGNIHPTDPGGFEPKFALYHEGRAPVAPAEPWTAEAEDARALRRMYDSRAWDIPERDLLHRLLARLAPAPAETQAVTDGVAGGEGADA